MAKAHLEFKGDHIGLALQAMSKKELMKCGDEEMARQVQESSFNRMYAGQLRDCDALAKDKRKARFAEVIHVTFIVVSVADVRPQEPPDWKGMVPHPRLGQGLETSGRDFRRHRRGYRACLGV